MRILVRKKGFSLIELLAVVAILAILILISFYAFKAQLAKGRDAKRKADLAKLQRALEDRLNDAICYPDGLVCNADFAPYLPKVPCDPLNNLYFNYFYSFDSAKSCKNWYKIYTKLENEKDPIIAKVGCTGGCGPSGNYNYWVSSPNMNKAAQIHPAEDWWPTIAGVTPTLPPGVTPTPTPILTPTPTPTLPPGATPTPTPISSPTPTSPPAGNYYGCFSGECKPIAGSWVCPNINYMLPDCGGQCIYPQNECK